MTSKISCFDRAVFRRSVRRTLPLLILLACYCLLLPLRLLSYCRGVSVCTEDFFAQVERTLLDYARMNASVLPFLFGGLLAHLGLGTGAHTAGKLLTDLDLVLTDRLIEILLICIHGHKFYAVDSVLDHPVNNIVACAANADHLDLDNAILNGFRHTLVPPMYLFAVGARLRLLDLLLLLPFLHSS